MSDCDAMKVTVCFGSVRVVVPCGRGEIFIKDLIQQATLRYKKATGKGGDSWVVVHSLQSQDGGLLDPDDRLNDVADDREQITANFEDGDGQHHHHGGGDGASGSSVGTGSPDIFQGESHKFQPFSRTDIEVTGEQIASGLLVAPLQVRRGSEPALNQLLPGSNNNAGSRVSSAAPGVSNGQHTWSAAPAITVEDEGPKEKRLYRKDGRPSRHTNGYLTPEWYHQDGKDDQHDRPAAPRFARDGSNRLSMQFLGEGSGFRWADAAERAAVVQANNTNRTQSKSLPRDHRRKEPLGQANSTSPTQPHSHIVQDSDIEDDLNSENLEYVVIHNEMGPLGIHVVPDYDRLGKDRGLLVQGIEPGGRIDRDGRLAVYDRIVEINGSNLLNMPFQRVQEIFKNSLRSTELRLRVIKHRSTLDGFKKPPPPVFPRSHKGDEKENVAMVEGEERLVSHKVATVSPTKKVSPGHPATRGTNSLLAANTRKIGRKIELELLKGAHGLGFSITTRDNPAGGNCPIYIKNILTKGAAVEDGRLKPGDRLLEVNNVEMTGKTQSEAVAVLRNSPSGSTVRIVVSRQEDSSSPKLPRQIETEDQMEGVSKLAPSPEKPPADWRIGDLTENGETRTAQEPPDDGGVVFPWKHREILTFDIPVHDTEKAGLGVSVKGKTTANHNLTNSTGSLASSTSVDLGIFIKSVLHGGAASRDGRLRTNDQLLNVNGISLLNQSNSDAMETLRRAMLSTEGPIPGVISITVARRASGPRDSTASHLSGSVSSGKDESYTPDNSGASENSDTTVIFLPYRTADVSRESEDKYKVPSTSDLIGSRNPVIGRLTGQMPSQNALRNESYYRATNEVWNTTVLLGGGKEVHSPTVNLHGPEMVMIEEEYHQPTSKGGPVDPTYTSQLSLEEAAGFSRDAFGRQSMSEKRHATLDAKHTDTYQRNKKVREERDRARQMQQQHQQMTAKYGREHMAGAMLRANSIESIISMARSQAESEHSDGRVRNEFGPSLGMKKSSSLESLQTMVQEIQMQEDCDPAYTYRNAQGAVRVIRGRGCNESFRAAVDRSYDAPLGDGRPSHSHEMETLAEEDGPTGEAGTMPAGSVPAFANVRGGPRQSSLNAGIDKNKLAKKKPGLFRGIGSMFRFGKHRKTLDTPLGFPGDGGAREAGEGGWDHSNEEREAARRAAQEEQQRIQEQYRRLMLRQRQNEANGVDGFPPTSHHREGSVSSSHTGPSSMGPSSMGPSSMGPLRGEGPVVMGPPAPLHKSHHREGSGASSSIHIGGSMHRQTARDGFVGSCIQISHPHGQRADNPRGVNYGPSMTHINPSQRDGSVVSTHIGSVHIGPSHNGQKDGSNSSGNSHRDMSAGSRQRDNSNSSIQSGTYRDAPISRERDGSGSSASSQKGQGSNYREGYQQEGPVPPPHGSQSRTERIHQLRAQHQRRHAERRGQYPLEEREEKYEEVIRQRLEQPDFSQTRPAPYDLYGEMSRPGSRVGITDPQRFSHYVNYEEIQLHLNRRQQHYHSQRRDNRETNHRPVSNFYEYESVQAFLRANRNQRSSNNLDGNSNSLPRRNAAPNSVQYHRPDDGTIAPNGQQHRVANVQDFAKNNLNKNTCPPLPLVHNVQAFQGQHRNGSANVEKVSNVAQRTQGPFITHVTIGQSQPPGSKV